MNNNRYGGGYSPYYRERRTGTNLFSVQTSEERGSEV